MISKQKAEEILESIWDADEAGEFTVEAVRRHCSEEISDAELAQLEADGLVLREGSRILFSAEGKERARGVVRRHRLTECLLTFVLKLPEEKAHDIACDMEHILPLEMVSSICTLLGHPSHSPGGLPIPRGEDCRQKQTTVGVAIVNLTELSAGEGGTVAYIQPKDHGRLHRLTAFGIVPGVFVELHQKYPAYCIKFEETELALDRDVAEDIYVRKPMDKA
jgi:DtxR family Mn-dependent transcriptional regulator